MRRNMRKKLPVGIDGFEKIRINDFYYVDKTMFIAELLDNWGEVNLFTRPRRFGKSLNMSMLKAFFETGCDKTLFNGLKILKEKELCDRYMGKYPVISITLKGVDGSSYHAACKALGSVIGTEAMRFQFLEESDKLTENEKNRYRSLINVNTDGEFTMSESVLLTSLKVLSDLLTKYYNCKIIILIDEYDVPLDKAFQAGYYDEMVSLIRNLFGNALKTNDSLYFAVLTGCLRISKESIFTGLNNLNVMTVTDKYFSDGFGFTEEEVKDMLKYYGVEDRLETMRDWYDGYQFGGLSIYCPWDVIKHTQTLLKDQDAEPENYWANTSENSMVRRFIESAGKQTKDEIEELINGGTIIKNVKQELTYNELDSSVENIWSVLFSTGYLTQRGRVTGRMYKLAIPNREVRELFINQIQEWFQNASRVDTSKLEQFCMAFPDGNAELIETLLREYLWNSISIRDIAVRMEMKENFYHGILLGLLQYESNWGIKSNAESGIGYSDISIKTPERIGVVIEIKYAQDGKLEKACADALEQIEEKRYDAGLRKAGMKTIVKYGIAFYGKDCKVMRE